MQDARVIGRYSSRRRPWSHRCCFICLVVVHLFLKPTHCL